MDLNKHILIVEDDVAISDLIQMNLEMVDYKTTQVFSGLEVVPALQSGSFDLILLDIMLPGIDGFSLMKYIKEFNIPVIFFTAKNSVMDKVAGI